jgi:hypothetical protein
MKPSIDRKKSTGTILTKTIPDSIILKTLTNKVHKNYLIDIWRYHHPNKNEFTHSVGTGSNELSESRIDMFLTSTDIITKPITTKILNSKKNSNLHHYPIEINIQNIAEKVNTNNYLNNRPKLDLKNTPDHRINEFKAEIEKELTRNIIDRVAMEKIISTAMKRTLLTETKSKLQEDKIDPDDQETLSLALS